jgi:hypothetical protein
LGISSRSSGRLVRSLRSLPPPPTQRSPAGGSPQANCVTPAASATSGPPSSAARPPPQVPPVPTTLVRRQDYGAQTIAGPPREWRRRLRPGNHGKATREWSNSRRNRWCARHSIGLP